MNTVRETLCCRQKLQILCLCSISEKCVRKYMCPNQQVKLLITWFVLNILRTNSRFNQIRACIQYILLLSTLRNTTDIARAHGTRQASVCAKKGFSQNSFSPYMKVKFTKLPTSYRLLQAQSRQSCSLTMHLHVSSDSILPIQGQYIYTPQEILIQQSLQLRKIP